MKKSVKIKNLLFKYNISILYILSILFLSEKVICPKRKNRIWNRNNHNRLCIFIILKNQKEVRCMNKSFSNYETYPNQK